MQKDTLKLIRKKAKHKTIPLKPAVELVTIEKKYFDWLLDRIEKLEMSNSVLHLGMETIEKMRGDLQEENKVLQDKIEAISFGLNRKIIDENIELHKKNKAIMKYVERITTS